MPKAEAVIWKTELDADDQTAQEELGIERVSNSVTYGRRVFFYAQNVDASVAVAQYDVVGRNLASMDRGKVTADATDTDLNQPAGQSLNGVTAAYYGWFLKKGYSPIINQNGGGDIGKGDALILSSTDGRVDGVSSGTAPTQAVVGFADAADVSTFTCSGYIDCP